MAKSHIAGILDSFGGLRVVVSDRKNMKDHVRPDEFLILVPNMTVAEPVPWNLIPVVVRLAELATKKWADRNHNDPSKQWASKLYRLRCLEQNRRSINLDKIVQT